LEEPDDLSSSGVPYRRKLSVSCHARKSARPGSRPSRWWRFRGGQLRAWVRRPGKPGRSNCRMQTSNSAALVRFRSSIMPGQEIGFSIEAIRSPEREMTDQLAHWTRSGDGNRAQIECVRQNGGL